MLKRLDIKKTYAIQSTYPNIGTKCLILNFYASMIIILTKQPSKMHCKSYGVY